MAQGRPGSDKPLYLFFLLLFFPRPVPPVTVLYLRITRDTDEAVTNNVKVSSVKQMDKFRPKKSTYRRLLDRC